MTLLAKNTRRVRVLENIIESICDGYISNSILWLTQKETELQKQGFFNITLEYRYYEQYGQDVFCLELWAWRIETDEEYDVRCKEFQDNREKLRQQEIEKENSERQEYERLKKKFEGI